MKITEVKKHLSVFLKAEGSEGFAKLISDSIDEALIDHPKSIRYYHNAVAKKLIAFGELDLLDRNKNIKQ